MQQFKIIMYIALKDLKIFATDRGALFFFILFPFLFVILFSFISFGSRDRRLVLNIVTQEQGGLSQQIIDAMVTKDTSQLKPGEPKIVHYGTYEEALQAVEEKEISGFLAFPDDFTEAMFVGFGTEIEVVVDAEAMYNRAVLSGIAHAISSRVSAQRVAMNAVIALLIEHDAFNSITMDDMSDQMRDKYTTQADSAMQVSAIDIVNEKIGEMKSVNPSNFSIPGYLVMFVFFAIVNSAPIMISERKNQTLERLLVSSVRKESLLVGMFAGGAVKGFVQVCIFWIVGVLAFGTDLGIAPHAVIVISIFMAFASSSFAMMLGTLVKTERSAGTISVLAALIFAALGGCWWPLYITPRWLQFIAKFTPHAWATTGFNKLLIFGADFRAVILEMVMLLVFTLGFGVIAIVSFRTSSK